MLASLLCDPFLTSFFQNNFSNNSQSKVNPVESDSPRQILLFRGLSSF